MSCLYLLSFGIFGFAWFLDFSFLPRSPPVYNYDSEIFFDPAKYFIPSCKDDLAQFLRMLGQSNSSRRVRVVGSGHSWSTIALSDETQISMANFKGLVASDEDSMQMTFGAGTTLHEVNAILDGLGLALPILGSISDQTVAGAISTGTHGSGIKYGNMASYVTKLELMTGNGELLTLQSNDSADFSLFSAAQVSLGLLGVITEVTFQCVPAFNLEETCEIRPLGYCLDKMNALVGGSEYIKMWVEVFSGTCAVIASNRTTEKPRDNPYQLVGLIKNVISEWLLVIMSWFPSIVPAFVSFLFKNGRAVEPHNRVDVSYRVLNIPHYFPHHHETEVVVGVAQCAAAIRLLKEFVVEQDIPLNYITEVRFVKGDRIPMSANYRRDSCHMTLCISNPSQYHKDLYFQGFYKVLVEKGFEPRLHWGKWFHLSSREVQTMYPLFADFLKLRKELDGGDIFLNKLVSLFIP